MQIVDKDGNVKWSPDSFGDFDIKKIEAIAKILSEITLKVEGVGSEGPSTRGEIDAIVLEHLSGYLKATDLSNTVSSLVEGRVAEILSNGGTYDIGSLRNQVIKMYTLLYGYDFNGNIDPNVVSYAAKFQNLESLTSSHTTSISQMMNIVFKTSGSSSYVRNVALRSETGELTNLKTTAKTSIVDAVNEVFQSCSNFKSKVAAAITAKGVSTSATATVDTIVENIGKINTNNGTLTTTFLQDCEVDVKSTALHTILSKTSTSKINILNMTDIGCRCKRCGERVDAAYRLYIDSSTSYTNLYRSDLPKSIEYKSSFTVRGSCAKTTHQCDEDTKGDLEFYLEGNTTTLS